MAATQQYQATGRRKTSVASVRMHEGSGRITVNGREYSEYFSTESARNTLLEPLDVTNKVKDFDIAIRTRGGGLTGQAGAASLGIARALLDSDESLKPQLRENGLLTRNPRMKERKKSGQPGARKRFQFSKR